MFYRKEVLVYIVNNKKDYIYMVELCKYNK